MIEWLNRPLEKVYSVIFIDAMVVKVRDGQIANKPVHVVIGVTTDSEQDILRLWAGDSGEGAKFWRVCDLNDPWISEGASAPTFVGSVPPFERWSGHCRRTGMSP